MKRVDTGVPEHRKTYTDEWSVMALGEDIDLFGCGKVRMGREEGCSVGLLCGGDTETFTKLSYMMDINHLLGEIESAGNSGFDDAGISMLYFRKVKLLG